MAKIKENGNILYTFDETISEVREARICAYWTDERIQAASPVEQYALPGGDHAARASVLPFQCEGRIYFTDPATGRDYWGCAQLCGERQIVLTAAHCVRNGETGEWHANFLFVHPGEVYGTEKYAVQAAAVKEAWWTNEVRYDYAFLVVLKDACCVSDTLPPDGSLPSEVVVLDYSEVYPRDLARALFAADGRMHAFAEEIDTALLKGGPVTALLDRAEDSAASQTICYSNAWRPVLDAAYGALYQFVADTCLYTRRVNLVNRWASPVRMRVLYGGNFGMDEHGNAKYFEDGAYDLPAYLGIQPGTETTLDLREAGIPQGAAVRLQAVTGQGEAYTAPERFVYRAESAESRCYELVGIPGVQPLLLV